MVLNWNFLHGKSPRRTGAVHMKSYHAQLDLCPLNLSVLSLSSQQKMKNKNEAYYLNGERLQSSVMQSDLIVLVHESQNYSMQLQQIIRKAKRMLSFIAREIEYKANLAVIVILSRGRCGLSRCITYYLVSMAVTDLLVIFTVVILNRIAGIYFPVSFLNITPICGLRSVLEYAFVGCSAWLTVAFTFDRFVAICCQKLKIKYCTEKTVVRVIGIVSILNCLKNTFWYFALEPLYTINTVPWFCGLKLIFYMSPAWAAYDWIHRILTPFLPCILILLFNALTVRHILVASKARKRLRAHSNVENQSDLEMEKRRMSIILLFAISGSFILLYLLSIITILYVRMANITYLSGSDFSESTFILEEYGYMLQLLSCCINPFIYTGTQSKFREELKNGVKHPLSLIVKLVKL
ncbi:probable G-protein coupled receptor 139 [Heterodontus francisci]|uniref:probable G-protein coupled receptor 139 n=1 Tax=Heterodontus francisci TaxID=7792 RepID=UPI00355C5FE2